MAGSPIFCAIDLADVDAAYAVASQVAPYVGGLKIGLEFFVANGPVGVQRLARLGLPLFLDLKLHDIPNTVAAAVRSAAALNVTFLTIHISGGREMMRRAVEAADGKVKLLGVTVLTSLDEDDLTATGQALPLSGQVARLGKLGLEYGLDGLVCSPHEVPALRLTGGSAPILMVPGIRPADTHTQDQKRTMSPASAISTGATYVVIGRPITQAADPAAAARAINESLAA